MMRLATDDDGAEAKVNWLALTDDEAIDLRALIIDDMPDVAERLRLMVYHFKLREI